MNTKTLTQDILIGLASGYAGTKTMSPVTTKLQEMESKQDQDQEKKVSPGVSYELAARDLANRAGLRLDDKEISKVGTGFELGLGLTAGELYVLLRRTTGIGAIPAGILVGLLLFAGIDEGLTPLMGWSAPDSQYPMATHLRGFLGHLTLGLSVAATAEVLSWLMDR